MVIRYSWPSHCYMCPIVLNVCICTITANYKCVSFKDKTCIQNKISGFNQETLTLVSVLIIIVHVIIIS